MEKNSNCGDLGVALGILLGVPDEIWGTHVQLIYLGFVAAVSLLSTSAAIIIEKGRYHT
jgi:hypothetical protein